MKKISLDKKFINRWLNRFEFKLKRTKLFSKPTFLTIEPTNSCNSRCIMCNKLKEYASSDFKAGFMSRDIFEKVLPWVSFASSVCWGGFGEPFLHPNYGEWAEDLKNAGANLTCFTNGINLKEFLSKKLVEIQFDSIHISLGGATEDVYKNIRGVNGLEKMLKNLEFLNGIKKDYNSKKPVVHFSLVAMNSVLPQLLDIVKLASKYNVESLEMPDLNIQYSENIEECIWLNIEKAKEYIEETKQLSNKLGLGFCSPTIKEKIDDCHDFFNLIQITYDGKILSCSNEKFILGDLNLNTLAEIWNNESYLRLRNDYYKNGIYKTCPECTRWDKSRQTMLKPTINLRGYDVNNEKIINEKFKENKVLVF
ncbi:MAG: radical SAM/SPASM domain-containing protein [Candidatus Hodarchaeota archaeon]